MHHEFLNLDRYAETLGDPAKYFVDHMDRAPRVVEHATGEVKYVIDRAGALRPFADYRAGKVAHHELPDHIPQPHVYAFGPRPQPAKAEGIDVASLPGTIDFGLKVG